MDIGHFMVILSVHWMEKSESHSFAISKFDQVSLILELDRFAFFIHVLDTSNFEYIKIQCKP